MDTETAEPKIDYAETKIDFSNLPEECKNKKFTEEEIIELLNSCDAKDLVRFPLIAKYITNKNKELEERYKKDMEAIEKYNYTLKQIHSTPEQRKQNAKERLLKKLESRKIEK